MINTKRPVNRRDFLKQAAAGTAAASFFSQAASAASQKTLRVLKWAHFLPDYDHWFEGAAHEWGAAHNTRIILDKVPVEKIAAAAWAEVKSGQGHDVCMFPWPPRHSKLRMTWASLCG